MLAYHVETNATLIEPFKLMNNHQRIAAYDRIMACLKNSGHSVNLQILDNKDSEAYKLKTQDKWNIDFQLVPLNTPRLNAAERAI